jgi:hypothetical protein
VFGMRIGKPNKKSHMFTTKINVLSNSTIEQPKQCNKMQTFLIISIQLKIFIHILSSAHSSCTEIHAMQHQNNG